MAKIQETNLVIKLSKLVRDQTPGDGVELAAEIPESIEAIVQELVGQDVIVEVTVA